MTRRTTAALALAVAAALAGCASTTAPSTPSSTSSAPQTASAPASGASVQPTGSLTTTNQGNSYRLTVDPAVRSGQVVTLTTHLEVLTAATTHLSDLSMLSDPTTPVTGASGIPNGLGLLDPVGQKLYMPATRTDDPTTALCSPAIPTDISRGQTITITCTYAAVPASLTQADITTPTFGTLHHVPIR